MSPPPSWAGLAFGVPLPARLVALGVPWHSDGAFPGTEGAETPRFQLRGFSRRCGMRDVAVPGLGQSVGYF